jgi:hypothetical protein
VHIDAVFALIRALAGHRPGGGRFATTRPQDSGMPATADGPMSSSSCRFPVLFSAVPRHAHSGAATESLSTPQCVTGGGCLITETAVWTRQ